MPDFHNPYNFVRTPGRNVEHPFAGDYDPSEPVREENHSRYWDKRYTGTIPVVLETRTPLFITDPETKEVDPEFKNEQKEEKKHYLYGTQHYIPATALKGMLSSVYEIMTNSRFRVFGKNHQRILGFRGAPNRGLIPGRITEKRDADGNLRVELFKGYRPQQVQNLQYAAWLPVYKRGKRPDEALLRLHGKHLDNVELSLYSHRRKRLAFWCVTEIAGHRLRPINDAVSLDQVIRSSGYINISQKTISNKHDERFFFNYRQDSELLSIRKEVKQKYEELIEDYRAVHEKGANPINDPQNLGIVHGGHINETSVPELKPGCFVYVKILDSEVAALYPVQISRELYECSPWDSVYNSILPAGKIKDLSPADRLFGWVAQQRDDGEKGVAWKGKIRISDGIYYPGEGEQMEEPVEVINPPLPLVILGAPKPAQARFYLGNTNGEQQEKGISKQNAGYSKKKKIRGRKVYLHQKREVGYWGEPIRSSAASEYFKPQKNNQNRSIKNWIPPGRKFKFNIKVENLRKEELGALLTLCTLSTVTEETFLNLGFAKPLGFGSVSLTLDLKHEDDYLDISTGSEIAKRYRCLLEPKPMGLSKVERKEIMQAYKEAVLRANGVKDNDIEKAWGEKLPFIEDMLAAMKLFGNVHYPRNTSGEEGYQWFVNNEKTRNGTLSFGYSLPPVGSMLHSTSEGV